MQVVTRRLIVISVIAVCGAAAGLTLGNFVAGGESIGGRGANESVGLDAASISDLQNVTEGPDFSTRPGPTSYSCEGCDARLHNDMIDGNVMAPADVSPLPPYRSEDAPMPSPTVPPPSPRRDAPVASPRLPGLTMPTPPVVPPDKREEEQHVALPID